MTTLKTARVVRLKTYVQCIAFSGKSTRKSWIEDRGSWIAGQGSFLGRSVFIFIFLINNKR